MKKIILVVLALISIYITYSTSKEKETVVIPSSAIRFRVLANSNSPRDQKLKEEVRDRLQRELYMLLENTKSINEARILINDKIVDFGDMVEEELNDAEYSFNIDYGLHEFPEKTYKGVVYEAGEYESLLVTLGEGKGDNWWCVLFPPLCILEAEEKTSANEIEYKSFIKEKLEKYF